MELDRSLLSWGSQPEPDGWSTGGSPHSVYCAVVPQRSANPSQLDHCPGGSPRLEDPHGPVFGAQSRN